MIYEKIVWQEDGAIVTITLNDPTSHNALSTQLTEELVHAFETANELSHIAAIIITGAGKSFCAGGDLAEFQSFLEMDVPTLYEDGLQSTGLFQLRDVMKKPIIGAINGAALGGGTGIAALCHIAIGSEHAKLGLTELKLGLVPYVILPLVRRAVGERQMMELMLSARVLSAEEALRYGLLHEVVPAEELQQRALNWAEKLASYSPLAVKMALTAFEKTAQMDVGDAMTYLATMRLVSFKSADLKEGAQAFLQKRQPNWTGK
ncbi:enoyl-CoA hydratase/isomerase family protein [Lysinibacillus xylanilyticus]|uniref:enoyl-CoA hydratase/isomerase family protein n=1 Tax=Lysinibacillus xylanilyticus TaxID=582475 RepID=UPI003D017947